MRSALAQDSSDWGRSSPRRRAAAIALTVIAEIIFLLILLGLNPPMPGQTPSSPGAMTFNLSPESPAKRAEPQERRRRAEPRRSKPAPAQTQPKAPPLPPSVLLPMSKADMAAADISGFGSRAAGEDSTGVASAAATGPGGGPGGVHLYNAEWFREPTDGELAYYLPKSGAAPGSWAQIGCQTVAHYRVENCVLLGESPMGSGLARAMRLASWQFRVRPPRIDGKPLVGSWVRIRIEFSKTAVDGGT